MICTTCKKEMAREVTQYKITYSCECGKEEFIKINTPFKLQSSILALKRVLPKIEITYRCQTNE